MKDREDIEASGKVWLEEMEAANRTKKKRKSGRKTAQK
jgi:hypothetical protein